SCRSPNKILERLDYSSDELLEYLTFHLRIVWNSGIYVRLSKSFAGGVSLTPPKPCSLHNPPLVKRLNSSRKNSGYRSLIETVVKIGLLMRERLSIVEPSRY